MRFNRYGLKKPDGNIQGTLDEQNILYCALENDIKMFYTCYEDSIEYDRRYWSQDVESFYDLENDNLSIIDSDEIEQKEIDNFYAAM